MLLTGWNLATGSVKRSNIIPIFIPPIIFIIGIFVLVAPNLINPKYFSRSNIYWVIIGLFTVLSLFLLGIYYVSTGIRIIDIISYYAFVSVSIPVIFKIIKNIISERKEKGISLDSKKKHPEVLGIISKHQRLTEEEITFHKEKKICLVCKGKLGGLLFMCIDCGALYCENCSRTLSDLENACWVCTTPFDKSKPSKPYGKTDEKIPEVAGKVGKKKKIK